MTEKQEALYRSKFITVDDALNMIHDGDTVYHGFYGNEPRNILREFHRVLDHVEHVNIDLSKNN
jgi:acyl-CoA hydrolase